MSLQWSLRLLGIRHRVLTLGKKIENAPRVEALSTLEATCEMRDAQRNKMEPDPNCVHHVLLSVYSPVVATGLARPNLLRFSRRVQCGWGLSFLVSGLKSWICAWPCLRPPADPPPQPDTADHKAVALPNPRVTARRNCQTLRS